jgi:hypothetical protein
VFLDTSDASFSGYRKLSYVQIQNANESHRIFLGPLPQSQAKNWGGKVGI